MIVKLWDEETCGYEKQDVKVVQLHRIWLDNQILIREEEASLAFTRSTHFQKSYKMFVWYVKGWDDMELQVREMASDQNDDSAQGADEWSYLAATTPIAPQPIMFDTQLASCL